MKAKVTLKEGFRYHRNDNTHVDLKAGDVIEADDIPTTERGERFMSGHLVAVEAPAPPPTAAEVKAAPVKAAGKK